MTVMLDADTCIDFMRGRFPTVIHKMQSLVPDEILIPAIVKAELLLGAHKGNNPERFLQITKKFLAPFRIISFDDAAAECYAKIRSDLEQRGMIIGANELLIAATALSLKATLVTRNTREFSRVNGLAIETWAELHN
ncbi:MAG: type II toxin-antitoxin system VapC family toxin [Coriobacteriales bacterium]|jgi:tRNA(fMet)-specific endonuclease VapC|nr:type II toxin-antitoxin system VapC family toxin [Coriobacteriales bacterium]